MILIRDPKTCFNFDLQKDFYENLKCEIGFIIKYKHSKNMNMQNECTI